MSLREALDEMTIALSNLVIGEYDPENGSWPGSVDVSGLSTNWWCQVAAYGKTSGLCEVVGIRQNNGTINLELADFMIDEELQPIAILGNANSTNSFRVVIANGLDDFPPIPIAPTLLDFTRSGDSGIATVSGVAAEDTCEIWAIPITDITGGLRVLVGSAPGAGAEQELELDLSDFHGEFFDVDSPCLVEAVAKNAEGAYGPASENILPVFIGTVAEFPMSLIRDGTTITITVEVEANDRIFIFYTDLNGEIKSKGRIGPGDLVFTNQSVTHAYQFVGLRLNELGAWIGWKTASESDFSKPSIVPRLKPEIARR
jgi:hypothetical protein